VTEEKKGAANPKMAKVAIISRRKKKLNSPDLDHSF